MPQTLDLSLAGIYTVTVRSDTSQPTDYTKTGTFDFNEEQIFEIEMIDPCVTSTMLPFFVADMERAVM